MLNKAVYLDHNATTPLDPLVIEAISESLRNDWGNPSSSYPPGTRAREQIQESRRKVGKMINCQDPEEEEIIFMSGGTEANNTVIHSVVKHYSKIIPKPHIITTNVEHDSIKKCLQSWEASGDIDVTYAEVDRARVSVESIIGEITPTTCLISVMHANNETGVIMPISEIGEALRSVNSERSEKGLPKIMFHTDAAQTVGKVKVDVEKLGVDYLTIVGHKFYGPRIGALYVRVQNQQTPFIPLFHGGGQEKGYRPGTENTPMIVGLGVAAELVSKNLENASLHMQRCRDLFESQLLSKIPGLQINFATQEASYLPNTLSVRVPSPLTAPKVLKDCNGQLLASVGAACHSNTARPSDILLASIRSVLGPSN